MRDQILEILTDIRPDIDFEKETKLIDDKILESFDIITIVGELNDAFDIEIGPKELVAENFNSLNALTEMVDDLVNG